jgi:LacI family transcriptional regulator
MATIKDIAKNLDLSFSTVSRALNNHPAISKKTKQLVEAEALRLNFAFNTSAKSLTSNKAYTITLLVNIDDEQSFQNPYFYEEMHGIERFVYQKEYSLIVANIKTAPKKQNMIDFLVKSKRTDWGYVFAMTTLAMIPVLLIYVLLQRYFVSGLASGAIKE